VFRSSKTNLNGTTGKKCPCGTWLNHWKNYSNQEVGKCSAYGCINEADRGGHVQRKDIDDMSWYIIPICLDHNNQFGKEYLVYDDTIFIPVTDTSRCKPL
jgi:hypothetical protein